MDAKSGIAPSLTPPVLEDDSIFGPPALSAYSIAILSAHSSSHNRLSSSPLSGAEIKENTKLKDSLKRKLSVHRGDGEPSSFARRVNFDSEALTKARSSKSISHSTSSTRTLIHESLDSISHSATSPGLTSTSSGSSLLGRPAHSPSTHNSFHNDDQHESVLNLPLIEKHNNMETLGINIYGATDGWDRAKDSNNQVSLHPNGIPYKKSRLSHNLRSLGPPKRASEMLVSAREAEDMSIEIGRDKPVALKEDSALKTDLTNTFELKSRKSIPNPFNDHDMSTETETLSQHLQSNKRDVARSKVLSFKNSEFIKGLESLKDRSPKPFMSLSFPPEEPSFQKSLQQRVYTKHNEILQTPNAKMELIKNSPVQPYAEPRKPLHDISSSAPNVEPRDHFVKPQMPRAVSNFHGNEPRHPVSREPELTNNLPKKIITVNSNHFEKLEILGRGGSSKVYRVRHVDSRKTFAIKKVDYDQFDESCIDGFKSEIEHLQKLKNHPRVINLEDHSIKDGSILLVMECGEVDLAHVLQNRLAGEPKLDVNFVRFNALEIFRCVEAVHQAGIVHSDLKPANFLFVKGFMKIIDFGIANAVPEHTANIYRESQIGTPNYMAPETLIEVGQANCPSNKDSANIWRVGKSSDVWSCGCIIYQMIYGKPPYASYSGQKRIQAIMNPNTKISFPEHGLGGVKVPPSAIILMQGCLDRLPGNRWSIEECLSSDFLRPKVVSRSYVRDLIYSAINFGMENKGSGILREEYDEMVETVIKQIEDLNFA